MNRPLYDNLYQQILSKLNSDISNELLIASGVITHTTPYKNFIFNKHPYKSVVPFNNVRNMHTSDTPCYTIKTEDAMVMQLRLRRLYMSFCVKTRLESYGLKYVSFACSRQPKIVEAVTDLNISNGGSLVLIVINESTFVFLIDVDITELNDDVITESYIDDEELFSELNEFFIDYTGFNVSEMLES